MSNLDISSFLKSGNLKKISLLEQRFRAESKSTNHMPEFGHFPGIQSFFHDFIVLGSCSRLHCNLLDVLFGSIRLIQAQLDSYRSNNNLDMDSDSNYFVLLEAQILKVLGKFCGFLYFLPYASSTSARTIQGMLYMIFSTNMPILTF